MYNVIDLKSLPIMTLRKFLKMHGLGNDFIIFDAREQPIILNELVIKSLCERKFGVGCDQLIVLKNSLHADAEMEIYNPDGSYASACGNAARCVAFLLGKPQATIMAGTRKLLAKICGDGTVTINMGHPDFNWQTIPLAYESNPLALEFKNAAPYNWGYAVSMGNPHLIFFVDNKLSEEEITRVGSKFEKHLLFPERTNVSFARIIDKQNVALKVWERGTGVTLACGSGACATAAVAYKLGKVAQEVNIHLLGGTLKISNDDSGVLMNGEVKEVFSGEVNIISAR